VFGLVLRLSADALADDVAAPKRARSRTFCRFLLLYVQSEHPIHEGPKSTVVVSDMA
jgi:hypothetical protein